MQPPGSAYDNRSGSDLSGLEHESPADRGDLRRRVRHVRRRHGAKRSRFRRKTSGEMREGNDGQETPRFHGHGGRASEATMEKEMTSRCGALWIS
nr:unnamed protein product [Digitaria exilis]